MLSRIWRTWGRRVSLISLGYVNFCSQLYFVVYSSADSCVPFLGLGACEGAPRSEHC